MYKISNLAEAGMIHGYNVDIASYCDNSQRSDEPYGDWSESYSNSLKSVTKSSKSSNVLSKFDFKKGDSAFLVWVEYSTGNSFGRSDRGCTEVIGIFKDVKHAKELAEKIQNHNDGKDVDTIKGDKYAYKFKTEDGQLFECGFASWVGYFENLEEIHIDHVTIK